MFWLTFLAFFALAVAAFAVVYFVLPDLLVSETGEGNGRLKHSELLEAENSVRTSGIQLLGGLVVVVGTALTAQSVARSLRLNRDGQLTERFANAVDQLGHDKEEIQVGGIHGLARVAYYSPFDEGPIYELLTSHLRDTQCDAQRRGSDRGESCRVEPGRRASRRASSRART